MKTPLRSSFVLWLLAMTLSATAAAPAASAPAAAAAAAASASASAPTTVPKVAPRPPVRGEKHPATPEEKRDSATEPSELSPPSRVMPKLELPLTPSGTGKATYVAPGKAGSSGGVDDSAARCNAMADAAARKECLDKLR